MKGGEHATAPRSRIAEYTPFIREQAARGVPLTAIARMVGRNEADVRLVVDLAPMQAIARPVVELKVKPVKIAKRSKPRLTGTRSGPRGHKPAKPRPMPKEAERIVLRVAGMYGRTFSEILSPWQGRDIAWVRQHVYHALYAVKRPDGRSKWSTLIIGEFIGGRDHTTVMWGMRQHQKRLDEAAEQARAA